LEARPPFLTTEGLLSRFGTDRGAAAEGSARFVAEGRAKPSPWSELKAQIFLGSERFVEAMQRHIRHDQPLREVPLQQKRPPARALSYYAARGADPDRAMAEAYRSGAYSLQAIGAYFGVSRTTVSRAVRKFESA
jgi:REP-associated tyrosine transposase